MHTHSPNPDTPLSTPARSSRAQQKLDAASLRQCEAVGDRLGSALRMVLAALPDSCRSVRETSRVLGVDFGTCQRVKAAAARTAPLDVLLYVPGSEALALFIDGAGKAEIGSQLLIPARTAIDQFTRLVTEYGPSLSKLRDRITATTGTTGGRSQTPRAAATRLTPEEICRQSLSQTYQQLVRKSTDIFVTIKVVAPSQGNPRMNEYASVYATVGYRQFEGAQPDVTTRVVRTETEQGEQHGVDVGLLNDRSMLQTGTSLLHEYCRTGDAKFTSVGRHGTVQTVLDVPAAMLGAPIDIVMANRTAPHTHPRFTKSPWYMLSQGFTSPTAYCCMDVYLHASIANIASVTSGALSADPLQLDMQKLTPVTAWHLRSPGNYPLQVLGEGVQGSVPTRWAHQNHAAHALFDRMKLNHEDFRCYRMEVRYPLIGSHYYVFAEFPRG